MKIGIINKSNNAPPEYKTKGAVGMDLSANLEKPIKLSPGEKITVPTGIYLEIPEGYEAQVRPRSGLAIVQGITVINSPGTLDPDYRGQVQVGLINLGKDTVIISNGDRIAQLVFNKVEIVELEFVEQLGLTERGSGGLGSTGINS